MKKPYLTPAGRKWLRARHAQLASEEASSLPAKIGAELLAHEADVIAPPRKRGRPRSDRSRLDDEFALNVYSFRCIALELKGEVPDHKEILRDVARKIDERTGWTGEPDARYRRLLRRNSRNISPRLSQMLDRARRGMAPQFKDRELPASVRQGLQDIARLLEDVVGVFWNKALAPEVLKMIEKVGAKGEPGH